MGIQSISSSYNFKKNAIVIQCVCTKVIMYNIDDSLMG
jgi:hypothetical protein